jgi:hypothetical protein
MDGRWCKYRTTVFGKSERIAKSKLIRVTLHLPGSNSVGNSAILNQDALGLIDLEH